MNSSQRRYNSHEEKAAKRVQRDSNLPEITVGNSILLSEFERSAGKKISQNK